MKENMFIKKNIMQLQMEEFIRNEFVDGKIGDIELQHTPVGARIIIHTLTPGYVIGSDGSKVREVTDKIREKFEIDNPQIDVQKIDNPDLDPSIVAQGLAAGIADNINYKKLGNQAIARIMRSGAIGVEIVFSGKFSGARGRRERFMAGYLKKCGETSKRLVRTAAAIATPRLGVVSVRVKIMVKKMPDIIDRKQLPDRKEEAPAEKEEAPAEKEEAPAEQKEEKAHIPENKETAKSGKKPVSKVQPVEPKSLPDDLSASRKKKSVKTDKKEKK